MVMNHYLRKAMAVIGFTVFHFAASKAVVAAVLASATADGFKPALSKWVQALIALTKVLYFPVVTLGLYPRRWFPGAWITAPILANSLLWGLFLYLVTVLSRKFFGHFIQRRTP